MLYYLLVFPRLYDVIYDVKYGFMWAKCSHHIAAPDSLYISLHRRFRENPPRTVCQAHAILDHNVCIDLACTLLLPKHSRNTEISKSLKIHKSRMVTEPGVTSRMFFQPENVGLKASAGIWNAICLHDLDSHSEMVAEWLCLSLLFDMGMPDNPKHLMINQ